MKVAIIGGGPGGLFLARLLKRSLPRAQVVVHEQNAHDATFGFGVGISMATRDRMREYDPEVYDGLARLSRFSNRQEITLNGKSLVLEYPVGAGAIRRLDLLGVLSDACVRAGVEVIYQSRVDAVDHLSQECDLVVASDGANSAVRTHYAHAFDVAGTPRSNHFAWFGVQRALEPSGLDFIDTPFGPFVGHYYAYGENLSTFVPECDDATWRAGGLDAMNDAQRKRFAQEVFAHRLGGAELVENKSIWRTFQSTHARRWNQGNVVLIGDALRIAHYSLGSGTRLAMEDAMALHDAIIGQGGEIGAALAAFDQARRPARDAFGHAADLSIDWHEDLRAQMRKPLVEFVHGYLTRTGRVSDDRLAKYAPAFAQTWADHQARKLAQTEANASGQAATT